MRYSTTPRSVAIFAQWRSRTAFSARSPGSGEPYASGDVESMSKRSTEPLMPRTPATGVHPLYVSMQLRAAHASAISSSLVMVMSFSSDSALIFNMAVRMRSRAFSTPPVCVCSAGRADDGAVLVPAAILARDLRAEGAELCVRQRGTLVDDGVLRRAEVADPYCHVRSDSFGGGEVPDVGALLVEERPVRDERVVDAATLEVTNLHHVVEAYGYVV